MAVIVPGASALSIERDVRVAMPDGITLATDIIRPAISEPVPALLVRTPYGRGPAPATDPADAISLVEAGYAVVCQDVRGRFGSEGEFRPFLDEGDDGAATIAWLAAQPWTTGRVGMLGGSYVGATQWLAAGRGAPALGAFVPYVTAADYHEGWTYQGGAFQLGFVLRWTLGSLSLAHLPSRQGEQATIERLQRAFDRIEDAYADGAGAVMELLDAVAPFYREWTAHPGRDAYWQGVAPRERYEAVQAPALNIGGWFDIFVGGTVENYRGLRSRGGSDAARRGTRLVIGPWSHTNTWREYAERSFGWGAELDAIDPTALHVRFFDHWLRDVDNGIDREPPVRLFVMGIDRWSDEPDWPLLDAEVRPLYLDGAGTLDETAPADEPASSYRYDPRDPVPSMGGATLMPGGRQGWNDGPWDQRPLEGRNDILRFVGPALERPLGVVGEVEAVLYISSSAPDTDFVARLIDVHPGGRAELLTEGILRARYRETLAEPRLLEPDAVYELRIALGPTANVFLPGHRVRLDITSSSFPRFDPNPNTGAELGAGRPGEAVAATNRVLHDRAHPSHLVLPVVDRDWRIE